MMSAFENLATAIVALDRRACAKPDLPPGRAYNNDCCAWDVCPSWLDATSKLNHLPRSGLAHAVYGGGRAHA